MNHHRNQIGRWMMMQNRHQMMMKHSVGMHPAILVQRYRLKLQLQYPW
jgi:hypothetical protein